MREAAKTLDSRLFEEYWDTVVPAEPEQRIREWLKRADKYAKTWKPSEHLFKDGSKK